ncbi:MAG TPA: ABC transporter permease [Nitrososphaerales archaeon]|nr:ABC transporter permease [Nitrososphaerales archaeon]
MAAAVNTVDYTTLYAVLAIAVIFGAATLVLATRGRMKQMNSKGVWGILAFTYREAIRTKWLIIFGVIFFLLAVDIPDLYLAAAQNLPPEYLPSNLADLISVSFPLIPLLPLPLGAVTIVDERESGTLQYLLSNPVTKAEFFIGRSAGLLLATTTVIVLGFGGAAAVVYSMSLAAYAPIVLIMLFAGLLNAAMLGIALIISEFSKRKATAMGVGIMVWFLLAVVSSLDQLVITVSLKLGAIAALGVVLFDPVESSRLLTVFGAGLGASQFTNSALVVQFVLKNSAFDGVLASVLTWIGVTFFIGFLIFRHQDAA